MTILERVLYAVKLGALGSVMFLFICLGIAILRISSDVNKISTSTQQTLAQVQASLQGIQKDVDNIQVMANATLFQAEEVLHHSDILIATENQAQKQQLARVNGVLDQLQVTVKNVDDSQKVITASATKALDTLPGVTKQLQATLVSTQANLDDLQVTVKQSQVLMKNSSDTMEHVSGITADMQTEVHKFVYPPPSPWYQRYVLGPIKLGIRMVTIPIR